MSEHTVLCVDDEPEILHALQRELRNVADRVFTATSGQEGLQLLAEHPIAVVVSDMRMPDMDGATFLHHVLEFAPNTFRIVLTGHADIQAAIAAINEGEIHRYLPKPWNAVELAHIIGQGFERCDLIRENMALTDSLSERNQQLSELNETLEQRVAERTQQLLHSERLSMVGRLAAGVVHEVMTPLTIAVGWVETVSQADNITAGQREALATVSEQILRAASIMENMQDFSRQKECHRYQRAHRPRAEVDGPPHAQKSHRNLARVHRQHSGGFGRGANIPGPAQSIGQCRRCPTPRGQTLHFHPHARTRNRTGLCRSLHRGQWPRHRPGLSRAHLRTLLHYQR
jgi:response regulator RpfG family c-di-GMP phosphodiesterase